MLYELCGAGGKPSTMVTAGKLVEHSLLPSAWFSEQALHSQALLRRHRLLATAVGGGGWRRGGMRHAACGVRRAGRIGSIYSGRD